MTSCMGIPGSDFNDFGFRALNKTSSILPTSFLPRTIQTANVNQRITFGESKETSWIMTKISHQCQLEQVLNKR